MSLDRSLKSANALIRHRNVLTRAERLEKLQEEERWTDGKSPFGLPKVAHRKMAVVKAVKEEAVEGAVVAGAAPATGAAPAAGAKASPGAKPAAGAKGGAAPAAGKAAAPAAGAKAAAPAAKKK